MNLHRLLQLLRLFLTLTTIAVADRLFDATLLSL